MHCSNAVLIIQVEVLQVTMKSDDGKIQIQLYSKNQSTLKNACENSMVDLLIHMLSMILYQICPVCK